MRYKALILLINIVLFLSCMKDETIELGVSSIEEPIIANTPPLPE